MINLSLLTGYCNIHSVAMASLEMQIVQLEARLPVSQRNQVINCLKEILMIFLGEIEKQELRLVTAIENHSDKLMTEVSEATKVLSLSLPLLPMDMKSSEKFVATLPREIGTILKDNEESKVAELRKLFAELRTKVTNLKLRLDAI